MQQRLMLQEVHEAKNNGDDLICLTRHGAGNSQIK